MGINNFLKNILKFKVFKKINHVFHFSEITIDEFIVIEARSEIKPGSRILDIGAGEVKYKKYFSDCDYKTQDFQGYKDVSGKFEYGEINYVCDALNIPVEDKSFDVVICTEVIEHLQRPELVIKEISRILKKGGKLYMTSCLVSGVHQPPHHYFSGFTRFWYSKYLEEMGFANILIKKKGGFFAFYSSETIRGLTYLIKSNKFINIILRPFYFFIMTLLPAFLFWLDKFNFEKSDINHDFTMGYLVKAKKI